MTDGSIFPDFVQQTTEQEAATAMDSWWVHGRKMKTPMGQPWLELLSKVSLAALTLQILRDAS